MVKFFMGLLLMSSMAVPGEALHGCPGEIFPVSPSEFCHVCPGGLFHGCPGEVFHWCPSEVFHGCPSVKSLMSVPVNPGSGESWLGVDG